MLPTTPKIAVVTQGVKSCGEIVFTPHLYMGAGARGEAGLGWRGTSRGHGLGPLLIAT
jgi:hypothetical protein